MTEMLTNIALISVTVAHLVLIAGMIYLMKH